MDFSLNFAVLLAVSLARCSHAQLIPAEVQAAPGPVPSFARVMKIQDALRILALADAAGVSLRDKPGE